ncbi:lipase family protein [Actinophytocola sp. NPDC049390]|uniref:lipase family protein n=1 Tax=Actinophytocola sp. NPDC049390 TaxID=3363894 RepID=UPI00379245BF
MRTGDVLERHPVPDWQWPVHAADAARIVFHSPGYDGSGRAAGGSVFLPVGTPPPGGWPVVSYVPGLGPGPTGPERVHVDRWLGAGYAVTVADQHSLGPHPYLNGEAVADDVVDIVRAARTTDPHVGKAWLVVGFSRGAHAALFTGLVASRYAPELHFRGTVAIAPPVHAPLLVAELTADGDRPLSPLLPYLLTGRESASSPRPAARWSRWPRSAGSTRSPTPPGTSPTTRAGSPLCTHDPGSRRCWTRAACR